MDATTPDEVLMQRYATQLDAAAFRELFARHGGRVNGFFVRGVGDAQAAADLTQTTFLHLHRARADYDPARPFRPWLFAIAANVRREHWRRRSRKPETSLEPGHEGSVGPSVSTATDRLVRRAVERLPDGQREVVLLRWYGGLSFAEIAGVLGLTTTAAKVRAHRAVKALGVLLGADRD